MTLKDSWVLGPLHESIVTRTKPSMLRVGRIRGVTISNGAHLNNAQSPVLAVKTTPTFLPEVQRHRLDPTMSIFYRARLNPMSPCDWSQINEEIRQL